MRFESVSAFSFGPFEDAELTFAPGMNVVFGSNEAGKSTWHAALYAGLCGMRRGAGITKEDRLFAERHRPWDGGRAWEVGATITLEDGRRVQLRHELLSRVDCSATDAEIADRDYSNEIMGDGSPDGSRWLGLDRRSFLSTACVRQADIVGILDDGRADDLQEQLQSAVSTAGTDATAARALDELDGFLVEHVGSERATTRPLPRARQSLTLARRAAESARADHSEYLARRTHVDELEAHARNRAVAALAARAMIAEQEYRVGEEQLSRARVLSRLFADGPPRATDDDARVRQVAVALQAWGALPELFAPSGRARRELEADLERLARPTQGAEDPASAVSSLRSGGSVVLGVAGVLAAVAGLALALAGVVLIGLPVLVFGIAVSTWWLLARQQAALTTADGGAATEALRISLERQIDARSREDELYQRARTDRDNAERLLFEAGAAIGDRRNGLENRVEALRAWEDARRLELDQVSEAQELWDELQRLLGDLTLEEFERQTDVSRDNLDQLRAQVLSESTTVVDQGESSVSDLGTLDNEAQVAREASVRALGELEEFSHGVPSVAGAEDDLSVAEEEVWRLERLDGTVRTTIEFLRRAEENVHRDIAPLLRDTVLEWLPQVTGGRYTDCRVDPDSLVVEVSSDGDGDRWRRADRLSHGTAEQVYLLLRFALTRHLTRPGEVCPLILDDAVGASDGDRKGEILETLLAFSEETQVILFTHEDDVRAWARERLVHPNSVLIDLDSATVPA